MVVVVGVIVVVVVVAVAAVLLVVAQCSGKRELACNLGQLGLVQNLGGGGGASLPVQAW